MVYGDTSGLMKLLIDEDGTTVMNGAVAQAPAVCSAAIAYVELAAALAAAVRDSRIPVLERDATMLALGQLWVGVLEIEVDHQLLRTAAGLAEERRLRAYDAVHLAALTLAGSPGEVSLACWDRELRRAAAELGYRLIPERLGEG